MKTIKCVLFSFTVLTADVSHAAIVNLSKELGSREMHSASFMNSTFGIQGRLMSLANSFSISADTLADTGSFTDMHFGVALEGGGTRTQTFTDTIVTPPTDFPDPPIITIITSTFTETVVLDPLSPANFAPQFLSSTVGTVSYLSHQGGFWYGFPSNVTIAFPDSFTVSGTYIVEGPTETVTVPFNVLYSRSMSANVTQTWLGLVDVGTDFPNTARAGVTPPRQAQASRFYDPATGLIFDGTVDGRTFSFRLFRTEIVATLPSIPEPMSVCLWVIGVIGCLRSRTLSAKKRQRYARRSSRATTIRLSASAICCSVWASKRNGWGAVVDHGWKFHSAKMADIPILGRLASVKNAPIHKHRSEVW